MWDDIIAMFQNVIRQKIACLSHALNYLSWRRVVDSLQLKMHVTCEFPLQWFKFINVLLHLFYKALLSFVKLQSSFGNKQNVNYRAVCIVNARACVCHWAASPPVF